MATQSTIQDTLQAEFSPPLDTSLIAAIVADYISGSDSINSNEVSQLREVLTNLAAEAEKELVDSDHLADFSQLHVSPASFADDASSSFDYSTTDNSGYSSTSSGVSDPLSKQPFSTPLGFLRAIFPHVPAANLQSVVANIGDRIDEVDMEALVEEVLTSEYVRELEERGLSESESMELGYEAPWNLVESKKKRGQSKQKKQKQKGTTITLVDVRQQQHARPTPSSSRPAPPDPWTQLASVAAHLSTLIPTHTTAYFQSIFHLPQHRTPAIALRSALADIARKQSKTISDELTEEESPLLFSMFEILTTSAMYTQLNVEERDQLLEDALFALRATGRDPNAALDVVQLLVELDADFSSREFAWGVYHQQAPRPKPSTTLPSGPPPVPPPPNPPRRAQTLPAPPVPPDAPRAPQQNPWKTVPTRPAPEGPHPLAGVVRAYTPQNPASAGGRKARGAGNGLGKGGKGDVGELSARELAARERARTRTWELLEQRRIVLREAGKAWQRRTARNYGGEVAAYFAERARQLQQEARKEQLDNAREMVMRTRQEHPTINRDSIDLHGTIIVEAVEISRQYLDEHWAPGKEIKIITGRGTHSLNGVGVLGPAVKNALAEDGWIVRTLQGGLLVTGSRSRR